MTQRLKAAQEKINYAATNQKAAHIALLCLKRVFKARSITKDKTEHFIMIKEGNTQQYIIQNVHAPQTNKIVSKYIN